MKMIIVSFVLLFGCNPMIHSQKVALRDVANEWNHFSIEGWWYPDSVQVLRDTFLIKRIVRKRSHYAIYALSRNKYYKIISSKNIRNSSNAIKIEKNKQYQLSIFEWVTMIVHYMDVGGRINGIEIEDDCEYGLFVAKELNGLYLKPDE